MPINLQKGASGCGLLGAVLSKPAQTEVLKPELCPCWCQCSNGSGDCQLLLASQRYGTKNVIRVKGLRI